MGWEQYCSHKVVGTYNGIHLNGGKPYGGYSLYNRTPSNFVIKIPDAIPSVFCSLRLWVQTRSSLSHAKRARVPIRFR